MAAGPEDAPVIEAVAQFAQGALAGLVEMDAIGPAPRRDADEVAGKARTGDDECRPRALRGRRQALDEIDEAALVGGASRNSTAATSAPAQASARAAARVSASPASTR